jgi:hypothetical protein
MTGNWSLETYLDGYPDVPGWWYREFLGAYSTAREALTRFAEHVDLEFPVPNYGTRTTPDDLLNPRLFYLISPSHKRRTGVQLVSLCHRLRVTRAP